MSNNLFTEEQYENALIDLFQDMGYEYECGYDVERSFRNPWYPEDIKKALRKLNPTLSEEVINVW